MSKQKNTNYKVGYGKPPKEHQFKKGAPPPNKRHPRKKAHIDVDALLNEPVVVQTKDGPRTMSPFEVSTRKLVQRALQHDDVSALYQVIHVFEEHGILTLPPERQTGGVLFVPKGVDLEEFAAGLEARAAMNEGRRR